MKFYCGYFGTPTFSAHVLERLITEASSDIDIPFIVTQPDKPVGRNHTMTESPVKIVGKKYALPVYENPRSIPMQILTKCDIVLVFAYGKIIKEDLLRAPKYGFWNIHPSVLPRYRGAAPVVYPIILGEKEVGVTLIKMDEKMDHGPVITQQKMALSPETFHNDLLNRLADMSYYIVIDAVKKIKTNSFEYAQQEDKNATYTRLLTRSDGYIPYGTLRKLMGNESLTSQELPSIIVEYLERNPTEKYMPLAGMTALWNLYRALLPWPGIWTKIEVESQKKRLKIVDMDYNQGAPVVTRVQLEGKNPVAFKDLF